MPDQQPPSNDEPTLAVAGVVQTLPLAAGQSEVHVGSAAGWRRPLGIHGWERELSFVAREGMTAALARSLRATLAAEQVAPKRFPWVARAIETSPLLAIASALTNDVRSQGIRVHTVGFDRVSSGFFYFAEGGGREPVRAQGNLIEMLSPSLTAKATNAEITALMEDAIDRLLVLLSNGEVSELRVELADALPRLSRDGTGLVGTDLDGFENQARTLFEGSARWEGGARRLVEELASAERSESPSAAVALFGQARRVTVPALDIVLGGRVLQLPPRPRWVVSGPPREQPQPAPSAESLPMGRPKPHDALAAKPLPQTTPNPSATSPSPPADRPAADANKASAPSPSPPADRPAADAKMPSTVAAAALPVPPVATPAPPVAPVVAAALPVAPVAAAALPATPVAAPRPVSATTPKPAPAAPTATPAASAISALPVGVVAAEEPASSPSAPPPPEPWPAEPRPQSPVAQGAEWVRAVASTPAGAALAGVETATASDMEALAAAARARIEAAIASNFDEAPVPAGTEPFTPANVGAGAELGPRATATVASPTDPERNAVGAGVEASVPANETATPASSPEAPALEMPLAPLAHDAGRPPTAALDKPTARRRHAPLVGFFLLLVFAALATFVWRWAGHHAIHLHLR